MPFTALIAGGIGAAGSVGSALIGANASKTASQQQVALQQQALAQQKQMFGVAQGALQPYATAGQSVLPTLQGLITPGSNQNALLSQTPGFQFASQYGTMAATNALSAKSGASAGPLAAAISQYNNGLAQNTWGNTVNALQGYAGMGASAGGALAGDAIGSGNAMAGTLTNTGNALASGTLGSASALSGGVTGASGSAQNALLYSQLFGNGGAGGGLYTPSAIGNIGNMNAASVSDAQSAAYGKAMGFT
jgi:hypothetical protein